MKVKVEYLVRKEKTIKIDDKYKKILDNDFTPYLTSDMIMDIYKVLEGKGECVEEVTYVTSENNDFMYEY
jgi:hypothetical protein